MEHIAEEKIEVVASNIKKPLTPHGLWIMSVATLDDIVSGAASGSFHLVLSAAPQHAPHLAFATNYLMLGSAVLGKKLKRWVIGLTRKYS